MFKTSRERQEELEKVWWEELAELGAPSAPGASKDKAVLPEGEETSVGWQVKSIQVKTAGRRHDSMVRCKSISGAHTWQTTTIAVVFPIYQDTQLLHRA